MDKLDLKLVYTMKLDCVQVTSLADMCLFYNSFV